MICFVGFEQLTLTYNLHVVYLSQSSVIIRALRNFFYIHTEGYEKWWYVDIKFSSSYYIFLFWIYCLHKHMVIYFAIHGECNNLHGHNVIAYDVKKGRDEIECVMMIQFFFISLSQKNWSMLPLAFAASFHIFYNLIIFSQFYVRLEASLSCYNFNACSD